MIGSVDPWMLAGLLYFGAGVGLFIFERGRRLFAYPSTEAPLRRTDMPWLAAVILSGGVLGPLLLMFGLRYTSAASASLLLNLEGLATMGIAWLIFRENVDRRLLIGAAAILSGAVILSWHAGAMSHTGASLLITAACLAWGIDNNLTRKISSTDPVRIALVKGLAAGSVNVSLALIQGAAFPPLATILAIALVGFLGYGVSLVLFVLALRYLGTARTGAYFSLAPFIGAGVALLLLHEPASFQLLIAALLMGLGLWLHLTEQHEHEHKHEVFEHEHAHIHDEHHQHAHTPFEDDGEPHTHLHWHKPLRHSHAHYPDLHHRHEHE